MNALLGAQLSCWIYEDGALPPGINGKVSKGVKRIPIKFLSLISTFHLLYEIVLNIVQVLATYVDNTFPGLKMALVEIAGVGNVMVVRGISLHFSPFLSPSMSLMQIY
jgi:hypothetical protein